MKGDQAPKMAKTVSSGRAEKGGARSTPLSLLSAHRSSSIESRPSNPYSSSGAGTGSSSESVDEWDPPPPAGTPSPRESGSPPPLAKMSTLPEGARRRETRAQVPGESRTPKARKTERTPRKLKKVGSVKERSLSMSLSSPSPAAVPAISVETMAELEELRGQLEEERERVAALTERKALMAAEAKRVRAERDELAREQGRLTEVVSKMEGQMLDLKVRHEQELGTKKKQVAITGSTANEHVELLEHAQALAQENEELRNQLGDATRAQRIMASEKESAELRAGALERELRGLRMGMEAQTREYEEDRRSLEDLLSEAEGEARRQAREAEAARREAEGERQLLEDLRQEMRDKLAAADAQIAHHAFEVASALERAEAAEAAREDAVRGGGSSLRGREEEDEKIEELEGEVSRLISALAQKEVELRRERGQKELAEMELRETREAMEAQANMIRDKIKALKKEKDAALAAGDKRVATMQREIAMLVDQKEAHMDAARKARASVEKAEQYLKALDVARVEVKRLRLERDLLNERVRVLEQGASKGLAVNVGWLVPDCLVKRGQDSAQVAPAVCVHDSPKTR